MGKLRNKTPAHGAKRRARTKPGKADDMQAALDEIKEARGRGRAARTKVAVDEDALEVRAGGEWEGVIKGRGDALERGGVGWDVKGISWTPLFFSLLDCPPLVPHWHAL